MMIFLCTRDAALADACLRLDAGRTETRQLSGIHQLRRQIVAGEDLLIIDLRWYREEDIPKLPCPTMALVEMPDFKQAMRLIRRGVRGYGNRHMRVENLKQAVTAIVGGQVWMPPAIISRMINTLPFVEPEPGAQAAIDQLSKREGEVARWVAQGLSNKELAHKLHISVRTVKAHLTSIFSKTGFRDRVELAIRMKNH
ncbi:MAG: response regulator transcription factor [Desulfobacterales bacterium]|nr:response regulator transcription factor [Desulfobacterales bacterium]